MLPVPGARPAAPFGMQRYQRLASDNEEEDEEDSDGENSLNEEEQGDGPIVLCRDAIQVRESTRVWMGVELVLPRSYTKTASDPTRLTSWDAAGSFFCNHDEEGDVSSGLFDGSLEWHDCEPSDEELEQPEWLDANGNIQLGDSEHNGFDNFTILMTGLCVAPVHFVHMWTRAPDRIKWIERVVLRRKKAALQAWHALLAFCQSHGRVANKIGAQEMMYMALVCMSPPKMGLCTRWLEHVAALQARCAHTIPIACWKEAGGFANETVWERLMDNFVFAASELHTVANRGMRDKRESPKLEAHLEDVLCLTQAYKHYVETRGKQQRRSELAARLAEYGAVIRADSRVCTSFINQTPLPGHTNPSQLDLEQTVQLVVDAKFLYDKTDYGARMGQAMQSRKKRYVRDWDGASDDSDEDGGGVEQIRKRCKIDALQACAPEHATLAQQVMARVL
jgi:hypothetical protein